MIGYECYGSYVLITPWTKNGNTIRGRVHSIGTTSTILLKPGDVVYYNFEEIQTTITLNGVELHAVAHWKIPLKEIPEVIDEDFPDGFPDDLIVKPFTLKPV